MPYRHTATLRTSRSIPADILRSTKIEENLRVRPEVARQYALIAAQRAIEQPKTVQSADARLSPNRSNRRRMRYTEDTLVEEMPTGNTSPRLPTTDIERPRSAAMAMEIQADDGQSQITASPQLDNGSRAKFVHHIRRTLRSASNSSRAEEQSRGRRISQSLKATLRRLFGGSASPTFPLQQVNAKRQYYASTEDHTAIDPIRNPVIPIPPPELVARMNARPSSEIFNAPPVVEDETPSIRTKGSRESLQTRSRVTSWTNSVTSRGTHQPAFMDSQAGDRTRLSIIQENVPHQPSLSISHRHRSPGYAVFEKPLRLDGLNNPLETERMLSELQRQIQRRSREPTSAPLDDSGSEVSTLDRRGSHRPLQYRSTTDRRVSVRKTIRPVENDSERTQMLPRRGLSNRRGRMRIAATPEDDVFEPSHSLPPRRRPSQARLHHKLSLQEIADLNEAHAALKKASLRETRSTFFPNKGQYPEYRTNPWQLAKKAESDRDRAALTHHTTQTPTNSHESDSMYSRRTSGTPYANTFLEKAEEPLRKSTGTAWIIETQPAIKQYQSLVSRAAEPVRVVSHRSSGSWKGWMASEVSKLEGSDDYDIEIQLPQEHPGMRGIGHVRESPQAHTTPGSEQKRSVSGAKQAIEAIRKISGLRLPKLKAKSSEAEDEVISRVGSNGLVKMPKLRATASTLQTQPNSDERVDGEACADLAPIPDPPTAQDGSKQPSQSYAISESPMTPFTKFMASDTSPLAGYELRERFDGRKNARHSTEREVRLRRMQGSILSSNKSRAQGPSQYPWLQRYRDSHFTEELSPVDVNRHGKPAGGGFGRGNDRSDAQEGPEFQNMERFAAHNPRAGRNFSDSPAFV